MVGSTTLFTGKHGRFAFGVVSLSFAGVIQLSTRLSPVDSLGIIPSKMFRRRPEPHILLFRRPLGTDPQTGRIDPELRREALKEYENQFGLKK